MPRVLSEAEFNALRDRVMASLPDGLQAADAERQFTGRMAQAVGEAENLPAKPEGSGTGRLLTNFAQAFNPVEIGKGLYSAVTDPVGTVKGIAGASMQQAGRAKDAFATARQTGAPLDYVNAAGQALGAIPLIGPPAAAAGEQIASGDVAGGVGAGLSMLATAAPGATVRGAGRILTPAVSRVPGAAGLASKLDDIARTKLATTIAPRGRSGTALRMTREVTDAADNLLREPGLTAWTPEGYQAALGGKVDEARNALDAAADARVAGRPIDTSRILTGLSDASEPYVARAAEGSSMPPRTPSNVVNGQVVPSPSASTVAPGAELARPAAGVSGGLGPNVRMGEVVDDAEHVVDGQRITTGGPIGRDVLPPEYGPAYGVIDRTIKEVQALGGQPHTAHYEALRRIRDARDITAGQVYTPSVVADYALRRGEGIGAAKSAGVIRDELAALDPATAAANQRFHKFKGPYDASVARAEIESAAPTVGRRIFQRMAGATAGAAAGGAGGAAVGAVVGPSVEQMLSNLPTTQIKQARGMAGAADMLRGKNPLEWAGISKKLRAALLARLLESQGGATPAP